MMIALCIIGGILLLLILLFLLGSVKIRLLYRERAKVVGSVLGIRFTLYGDDLPEKPDLTKCKDPKKALKLELKYQKKYRAKLEKKRKRAEAHKAKKAGAPQRKTVGDVLEFLKMAFRLLKKLYAETRGKVKIKCVRMHIKVATDDAAKTALLYGATVGTASGLLGWVDQNFNHIHRDPGDMTIEPDYTTDKPSADIDITLGIRLHRAIRVWLSMSRNLRAEQEAQKARKRQQTQAK